MKFQASIAFAVALALSIARAATLPAPAICPIPPASTRRRRRCTRRNSTPAKAASSIEVHRDWAPNGADRFYNLVKNGFYNDVRFFRVLEGFMAQFGINGDPNLSAVWRNANIKDDPVKQSNTRGMITFATAGPNTRTTQVFINFGDNAGLDGQGFSPFGKVVSGMDVVDSLYGGYGEGAPNGAGPDQGRVQSKATPIWRSRFPSSTTSRPRPSCNRPVRRGEFDHG